MKKIYQSPMFESENVINDFLMSSNDVFIDGAEGLPWTSSAVETSIWD